MQPAFRNYSKLGKDDYLPVEETDWYREICEVSMADIAENDVKRLWVEDDLSANGRRGASEGVRRGSVAVVRSRV